MTASRSRGYEITAHKSALAPAEAGVLVAIDADVHHDDTTIRYRPRVAAPDTLSGPGITGIHMGATMTDFSDRVAREVWATVQAMNEAWTKGRPESLAEFFHPDMVAFTPLERERVDGRAACMLGWKEFCDNPQVRVYGDAAVVTYYYDMECDLEGHTINMSGRDMFFFVKEEGKWLAVADQFSPFPG